MSPEISGTAPTSTRDGVGGFFLEKVGKPPVVLIAFLIPKSYRDHAKIEVLWWSTMLVV